MKGAEFFEMHSYMLTDVFAQKRSAAVYNSLLDLVLKT